MRNLIVILAIAIGFSACKKEAGEGGTSVIEGKVYKIYTYQTPQGQIDTLYYQLDVGKDIFIIYSDDKTAIYDDEFDSIEIKSNNSTNKVEDFIIEKNQ